MSALTQMDLPTGLREGILASGDVWEKMIYDHCVAKKGFVDDGGYLSEEKVHCLDLNCIEILVYKLPDGRQKFSRIGLLTTNENEPRRPKKVPYDRLEDWISQKGSYSKRELPPEDQDAVFIGGLRLLYQQWPQPELKPAAAKGTISSSKESLHVYKEDFDNSTPDWKRYEPHPASGEHIPFKRNLLPDQKVQTLLSSNWPFSLFVLLDIPYSYPSDLTGRVAVPLRVKKSKNKLSFVVQSPRYPDHSFITTACSFDCKTKVTTGYLAYIHDENNWNKSVEGHMHNVLRALNDLSSLVTHPLLIPTLIVKHWCDYYDGELDASANNLKATQEQIKLIERELRRPMQHGSQDNDHDQETKTYKEDLYEDTHVQLVNLQRALLKENFAFINSLARSCLVSLAEVDSHVEKSTNETCTGGPELQTILQHLCGTIVSDGQRRDRLIKRMDASFQQLYNNTQFLVQQGDAKVNKSNNQQMRIDSAAVKRISIVTMLFLPGTAVATIFGMLPFFSTVEQPFHVSEKFWIFWAWTIPLTIVVMVLWFINVTYHPFHWLKELLWYIAIKIDPTLRKKYGEAYPEEPDNFVKPHLRSFLEDTVPKPEDKSLFDSMPWPRRKLFLGAILSRRRDKFPQDEECGGAGGGSGESTSNRSNTSTVDEKAVVTEESDEHKKSKKRWRLWT